MRKFVASRAILNEIVKRVVQAEDNDRRWKHRSAENNTILNRVNMHGNPCDSDNTKSNYNNYNNVKFKIHTEVKYMCKTQKVRGINGVHMS